MLTLFVWYLARGGNRYHLTRCEVLWPSYKRLTCEWTKINVVQNLYKMKKNSCLFLLFNEQRSKEKLVIKMTSHHFLLLGQRAQQYRKPCALQAFSCSQSIFFELLRLRVRVRAQKKRLMFPSVYSCPLYTPTCFLDCFLFYYAIGSLILLYRMS